MIQPHKLAQLQPNLAAVVREIAEAVQDSSLHIQIGIAVLDGKGYSAISAQGRPLAEVNQLRKAAGWSPLDEKSNLGILPTRVLGQELFREPLAAACSIRFLQPLAPKQQEEVLEQIRFVAAKADLEVEIGGSGHIFIFSTPNQSA